MSWWQEGRLALSSASLSLLLNINALQVWFSNASSIVILLRKRLVALTV